MATQSLSTQAQESNTPDIEAHIAAITRAAEEADDYDLPLLADLTTEAAIAEMKEAARAFGRSLVAVHRALYEPSIHTPRVPGYVLALYSLDKLHYSLDYMVQHAVTYARMLAAITKAAMEGAVKPRLRHMSKCEARHEGHRIYQGVHRGTSGPRHQS